MSEIVEASIDNTRFTMLVLSGFAFAALLLAGVGLYGTLAYLTSQRTQEFGVRLALGASGGSILRLVVGEGCVLTGLGAALGLAGALAVCRRAARLALRRHSARWSHHRVRRCARCRRGAGRRRLAGLAGGSRRSGYRAASGVVSDAWAAAA